MKHAVNLPAAPVMMPPGGMIPGMNVPPGAMIQGPGGVGMMMRPAGFPFPGMSEYLFLVFQRKFYNCFSSIYSSIQCLHRWQDFQYLKEECRHGLFVPIVLRKNLERVKRLEQKPRQEMNMEMR